LDAASGQARWQGGILTHGAVESRPTIVNGRVYVGSGDSRLYCLDAATGGEYWHYSTSDAIYASPLLEDGVVYVASSGNLLAALDALSGEPVWKLRIRIALIYTLALGQDAIYFVAQGDPNLYAVDKGSGKLRWALDTGDWLASGPVIASGHLYLAGKDGTVLAYALPTPQ
jgi:outer membrane protein assembly factor BamB